MEEKKSKRDGVQISILRSTRQALKALGKKGQTYDDVIREMLAKRKGGDEKWKRE